MGANYEGTGTWPTSVRHAGHESSQNSGYFRVSE